MSRCRYESKAYQHEVDRINQFISKAKDEEHLRSLLLRRAAKCGPEKLGKFVEVLREMKRGDLAGFIEMTMK